MPAQAADIFERVLLDPERLAGLGRANAARYAAATPFPHIVLDDVFDPAVLDGVLEEFPGARDIEWIDFKSQHDLKLASRDEKQLGVVTRCFIHALNSSVFVSFLEALTGIEGLIPDPHLEGGGLHQILPGGYLKIHADFNRYDRLRLDRRLNVLLYLNKDWSEEWGGHLELWSTDMKACVHKVAPAFNRMVVFSTTDTAFHGHPEPLRCPAERSRRSIALYYYTNGRPETETAPAHSTLYQLRPAERVPFKWRLKHALGRWLPPVIQDAWQRVAR
jgi:hypothetical protein